MTRSNWQNDGTAFEELLTVSCEQYESRGMALIQKTPNPWIVKRRGERIVGAFPDPKRKMVDYVGVSDGRAIHFEAKSTTETTRFDLKNIEDHQYDKLLKSYDQGAISGVAIGFVKLHEYYWVPFPVLALHWSKYKGDGRKSIPYHVLHTTCDQLKTGRGIFLDFLSVMIK